MKKHSMTEQTDTNATQPGTLYRLFAQHPKEAGESYFRHWLAAMGFAGYLVVTALAAIVHALIPGLCVTTASRRIATLNDTLQKRCH